MHADEVFAVAFLNFFHGNFKLKVQRTRNTKIINAAKMRHDIIVLDVGLKYNPNLKNFDHHQAEYRGNKSSFGLVFDAYKEKFKDRFQIGDETVALFEDRLVKPIDDWDNNNNNIIKQSKELGIVSLQQVISSFNTSLHNIYTQSQDRNFNEAVKLAIKVIRGEVRNSFGIYKQEQRIEYYTKVGLVKIEGTKMLSKIYLESYKEWANKAGIQYVLFPVPNSERLYDYSIVSLNIDNKLPLSKRTLFKHKNGHFALFSKWNDAFEFFQKL